MLLVHLEGSRWLALASLLLERIVLDDVLHEFVWRFLIELLWEGAHVLDTVWRHALITGSEVSLITIGLIIAKLYKVMIVPIIITLRV